MTDEDRVGQWVRIVEGDRRWQRRPWHRVESMIAGEPITKCGRRLKRMTELGAGYSSLLHYSPVPNNSPGGPSWVTVCERCS